MDLAISVHRMRGSTCGMEGVERNAATGAHQATPPPACQKARPSNQKVNGDKLLIDSFERA